MQLYSTIALIFSLLVCVFVLCICIKNLFVHEKKAKSKKAFTSLLDYAYLTDHNTIVLKNGALMKIYKLKVECLSYLDENEIVKRQKCLSDAIKEVNNNFIINFDVIRQKDLKGFDNNHEYKGNDKAKELFLKREKQLESDCIFENKYYLTITDLGSSLDTKSFVRFFQKNNKDNDLNCQEELLNFTKEVDRFIQRIKECFSLSECSYKTITSLLTHESISFLRECISFNHQDLIIPTKPFFLDMVLSENDFYTGLIPKIGDKYISVVAIETVYNQSHFCLLNELSTLNFEYRFSSRFICFDKLKSNLQLEKYRRFWAQKKRGLLNQFTQSGSINKDALLQEENAKDAKNDLNNNSISFGSYNCNIIIYDDNVQSLQKKAKSVLQKALKLGFCGRIETINATDAYLGSLPGSSVENVRRALISNEVFSDFLPLNTSFKGEKYSPNTKFFYEKAPPLMYVRSLDNCLCYLNLHINELANCLVLGPTGAGKSVFLASLIPSLLQYEDMHIFCFDKGNSFKSICEYLNGENILLSESSETCLCPLYDLETEEDLAFAYEFILSIFEYNDIELTIDDKKEIQVAIELLSKLDSKRHSLSDLLCVLTSLPLKQVIEDYTKGMCEHALLDGDCNNISNNALTVFECSNLFSRGKRHIYPVLLAVFKEINKAVLKSKASAILIDEAWLMLKDPVFNKELITWIKTLRKHNVTVVLATQSITDFFNTENFVDILDCVQTRVFLPNKALSAEHLKQYYRHMNLNELQINEIATGIEKRQFFLQKQDCFMPFELILSDKEKELLAIKNDESLENRTKSNE